ncbi:hypothetical protein DFH27DRAFT_192777 [Peziza echinospora]|nr:hypothetical protein DFH27DRAFT_192777 [Peziza echinospora]
MGTMATLTAPTVLSQTTHSKIASTYKSSLQESGREVPARNGPIGYTGTCPEDNHPQDIPTNTTPQIKTLTKTTSTNTTSTPSQATASSHPLESPQKASTSISSSYVFDWRRKHDALLYYTDTEWKNYIKDRSLKDTDIETFIKECWIPSASSLSGNLGEEDTQNRLNVDVMDVLGKYDDDYTFPSILHLIVGATGFKIEEERGVTTIKVGQCHYETMQQVHQSYEKRGKLLEYVLDHHGSLYRKSGAIDYETPVLLRALWKVKFLPLVAAEDPESLYTNPFLQLLVTKDPEDSAKQLDPLYWTSGGHRGGPKEADVPKHIHDLLPRICSPDTVGLECASQLFPRLGTRLMALPDADGNTLLHIAARYRCVSDESEDAQIELLKVLKSIIKKYSGSVGKLNKNSESPYLHRVHTYQKATGASKEFIPMDIVTRYLKHLCIRLFEPAETLKLIYAEDDEKREQQARFYLNLSGAMIEGKSYKRSQVRFFLDRLSLDETLKFVDIAPFSFVDDVSDLDGTHESAESITKVTKDHRPGSCSFVFEYLKQLGVRKIFEVAVEEENTFNRNVPPHTNDEIIHCFAAAPPPTAQGMNENGQSPVEPYSRHIRTWDWRKVDLCDEVLREAAPNVRTVHLYTSGNNSVLRSWSSLEGLVVLPKLEKIYLTVCKEHVVETAKSVRKSLAQFQTRMEAFCSQIGRVIDIAGIDDECLADIELEQQRASNKASHGPSPGYAKKNVGNSNENKNLQVPAWFKKLNTYIEYINKFPTPGDRPIKVAVLDDGYDMIEDDIIKHCDLAPTTFKAMDTPNVGHRSANSWDVNGRRKSRFINHRRKVPFCSEFGHGTLMAKLIRKMCPKVHLYIARLDNIPSFEGTSFGPKTASAAEAINWAVKCGVDIISMSWSIGTTSVWSREEPTLDERMFKAAIVSARERRILMFGAARDQGNNTVIEPTLYPAFAPGVFCIVSADQHGQLNASVGQVERDGKYTYAFPGEDPSAQVNGRIQARSTGSSIATAFAAGFTALLLHSLEASEFEEKYECDLAYLRRFEVMARMLEGMLVPGTRYLGMGAQFRHELLQLGDWDQVGKKALRLMLRKLMGSVV